MARLAAAVGDEGWNQDGAVTPLPEYTAGTWGPAEGEVLLARDRRIWRRL